MELKNNYMKILFNSPSFQGNEIEYISKAISNAHISGNGPFTKKCSQFFEEHLGVLKCLLTTSCTDALEMCAILLNIQAGDEVILPDFTFVSTANAFVLRGAIPKFVDIRSDTFNIDENLIESQITSKTKAIVVVHYAGIACEMDKILEISKRYNIPVIEDNAHGLFGKYKNKNLGTFGALATLSFHETKNITCGEGGALLINDPQYIDRAQIIWEKGTNRHQFFSGLADKYSWVDIGSSFLMSDLLAAFLLAQLHNFEIIQAKRKYIFDFYIKSLGAWTIEQGVQLPTIPLNMVSAYHMFYLIFPSSNIRHRFIEHMRTQNILTVFHYLPLHESPMGKNFSLENCKFPITDSISERIVRLPFFNSINDAELQTVVDAATRFRV